MKKLFLAMTLVIFMVVSVGAVEWHTANQTTVAWDAVTVAEGEVIKYGVYLKVLPTGEPVFLGEETATEKVITLSEEGEYIVGVTSIRYVNPGTPEEERLESDINWSDLNGESTPNPFGLRFYVTPRSPINLRIAQ